MNVNVESRLTALETQMQEIRDLLQQTIVVVNRTTQLAESNARSIQATTQLAESNARAVQVAAQIAESNARSIQAWEARIEENKVEAEEECSRLAVRLTELEQASRENIQQHFAFMQRFDETLAEIRRIWQRVDS